MDITAILTRHADWHLEHAVLDERSPLPGLWRSMTDLKTGMDAPAGRPAGVYKRCYRWIESPGGINLYWDLPLLAAFKALSGHTGETRYAAAAERYVRSYTAAATSAGGLWWWGNHYYIGAEGMPLWFTGSSNPRPVESGDEAPLHETRPLPVPWLLLHGIVPESTLAALAGHVRHLVEADMPGAFNRHADGAWGCAFPEAGGILALAFAWHSELTGCAVAAQHARSVLEFSWAQRDEGTNLMPVNPRAQRWDGWQTTSETGLWAGAAFAVADILKMPELAVMAAEAIGAWSAAAWSEREARYHGRLIISTGEPNPAPKDTIYCPGTWSDPWQPLFPAHEYPLQAAEASLTALNATGEERHLQAAERWVKQIKSTLPARNGWGAYAEHYGRTIHFFLRAGRMMERPEWTELAHSTAEEALTVLDVKYALRSHPWEDRIDSVDGLGLLMLALLSLETDAEQETYGMFW